MSDRLRVLTLVGAVVVIVVVIGIVLLFGLRPYPSLPSLADQPDPPVSGRLATIEHGIGGPCLLVVEGDGTRRELGCGRAYEGEIYWVADGQLGVRTLGRSAFDSVDVLDATTGEVLYELEGQDDPAPGLMQVNDDGDRVSVDGREPTARVLLTRDGGDREVLLELEGPEGYVFFDAGWTADGRWIAAIDSIGRVVTIDPRGVVEARIWAEDIGYLVLR